MTDSILSHPSHGTVTVHEPCHVTYHRSKNDPNFWNPWSYFVYLLCHLQGATIEIKLFRDIKATKFSGHAQYHVTYA